MARKRQYTLDEYSALKSAYNVSYSRSDIFISLAKPFFYIFVYTFLLYYYVWLSIIFGIVASLYQYRRVMLLQARREFEQNAFAERNKFINNLTQILTNDKITTIDGLFEVRDRTNGEFKENLTTLLTGVSDANPNRLHEIIDEFKSNYKGDVIFLQYVDQLETALLDGRTNTEILKDIRSFHNLIKIKREYFMSLKETRKKQFKMVVNLLLVLMIAITYFFGFKEYIEAYAHTPIGWISNTLFLGGIFLIFSRHLKRQEDDSVLEVDM